MKVSQLPTLQARCSCECWKHVAQVVPALWSEKPSCAKCACAVCCSYEVSSLLTLQAHYCCECCTTKQLHVNVLHVTKWKFLYCPHCRHGAAVNAEDVQHKTALHYAVQEHRLDTTKVILNSFQNPICVSNISTTRFFWEMAQTPWRSPNMAMTSFRLPA